MPALQILGIKSAGNMENGLAVLDQPTERRVVDCGSRAVNDLCFSVPTLICFAT
jgi:hypothetical protein